MFGRRAVENPELRAARAQRRKAIARAMLGGAMLGSLVTAIPLAALVAVLYANAATRVRVDAVITIEAVAVAAALAAITRGVSVAMNSPWRAGAGADRPGRAKPPANERPFDERLAQYLSEGPTPAAGTGPRHRMAFFLAFLPGGRSGPKSPGYIREILWRIRRLLRSDGSA